MKLILSRGNIRRKIEEKNTDFVSYFNFFLKKKLEHALLHGKTVITNNLTGVTIMPVADDFFQ